MRQYLDVLRKAMTEGDDRQDRTGVGTRAIFGEVMRFRMSDGFPAMTTKRLAFRSVVAELLWFLNGSSDVRELHALGVHIWDGKDRKSTRLNSSHTVISYAVFCLKKKKQNN